MLEQLKNLAMRKLQEKMLGNSLSEGATSEAASEGVGALLESLKGGDMSQITALLGGAAGEGNEAGLVGNIQGKLKDILQAKGMDAAEAETESASTASDLVNGLKEKFQSTSEEDKDFDISNITDLLGGDAAGLLNKAKNIFG